MNTNHEDVMAPHTPHREPSTQLAAPANMPQGAIAAMQRGDLKGTLQAYGAQVGLDPTALTVADDTDAGRLRALLQRVAADMLELRRENVAVLGSQEAFIRRFPNGALQQVVRPVQLSMDDGTLYRIPLRWVDHNPVYDETRAQVTAMGFDRLNAVAGCHIGLPASVSVEGVELANPYVERAQTSDGPGDVRRIVVKVIVIGPSPATGNPVGVTYLLDYDPRVDLRLALMKLARPQGRNDKTERADRPVQIIPASTWVDFLKAKSKGAAKDGADDARFRWHMLPLHAGLVLAYDLHHEDVLEVQHDFLKGTQHLTKKAQTQAKRNAMRAHPALAYGTVATPDRKSARLGIVGWTSTGQMDAYLSTLDRLSKGLPLPEGALEKHDVIEATYDDAMAEDATAAERAENGTAPPSSSDREREERALLISQIDDAMMSTTLRNGEIRSLNYTPATNTAEELRAILARLTTR